ncbi:MAG: hypothetical protein AAGA23_21025 [Pseudomonadota bacterium]
MNGQGIALRGLAVALLVAGPALAFAADIEVRVLSNRFLPEAVSLTAGDTLVFQVEQGRHALSGAAQDGLPGLRSGTLRPGDEFRLTVSESAGVYFFESDGSADMRGAVEVLNTDPGFAVDTRVSAGWFNPAASGQGLLFEFVPSTGQLVAYWFTFDFETGEQLWLIGVGPVDGARAVLPLQRAEGGRLDDPRTVTKPLWGELTVDFADCSNATVYFDAREPQRSGRVALERLYLSDLCQ